MRAANTIRRAAVVAFAALAFPATDARSQGRGRGGGGAGGGMPAELQGAIHRLYADSEKIRRQVEFTPDGYRSLTTTPDEELVAVLQTHVEQMSGRLAAGQPVRRWDPAFEEFFAHYDEMEHEFTKLDDGIRAEVRGKTPAAVAVAQNHARIVFDFSTRGAEEAHRPHRNALDDDGGEAGRFRGGPRAARRVELGKTFAEQASDAADELVRALGSQLKAALGAGGPVAALPVCHAVAMPITDGLSRRSEGLAVRRVTDRPRNPANRLDGLDRLAFERFHAAPEDAKPTAILTTGEDGRGAHLYRPLIVGETCLKCHGDKEAMSKELRDAIAERYPDDRAHGYERGDLRGFIRVDRTGD